MKAKILWIEGKRAEGPSFVPLLKKKDYQIETVPTGAAALEAAFEIDPDLVVVNAASMRTSGKRICRLLKDKLNGLPIILIASAEPVHAVENCASVVLTLPFTVRKLINRISSFVPSEEGRLIHVGHLRLDMERKQVRCMSKESRLTPRLARLLQILMQHPGEVVGREDLFREVWKTEYTADTRTLDVHISWLREAIEEDPRKPRYLKTIRKVGYRLDP